MMRSLYSGVSGLRNHQTRMDVIGNNIANVNTVGFKSSRTIFQDIYSQTTRSASSATPAVGTPTLGGTNPSQIGLGVKLSVIDTLHTAAATQRTDNPLDLAIEGDGYFMIQQGNNTYYTRAGNFYVDNLGDLVTANGDFVLGGSSLSSIREQLQTLLTTEETESLIAEVKNSSGTPAGAVVDDDDLPTISDLENLRNLLDETVNHGAANTIGSFAKFEAAFNSLRDMINNFSFPTNGNSAKPEQQEALTKLQALWQGGTAAGTGAMQNAVDRFGTALNDYVGAAVDADDIPSDTVMYVDRITGLNDYLNIAIDNSGVIRGIPRDSVTGAKVIVGTIALGTFINPTGLEKVGNSLYAASSNSGSATASFSGHENAGNINVGGLEMSNVDLSGEFTDMIVTQRGFQANSRIITVSDTLLEELINLKR